MRSFTLGSTMRRIVLQGPHEVKTGKETSIAQPIMKSNHRNERQKNGGKKILFPIFLQVFLPLPPVGNQAASTPPSSSLPSPLTYSARRQNHQAIETLRRVAEVIGEGQAAAHSRRRRAQWSPCGIGQIGFILYLIRLPKRPGPSQDYVGSNGLRGKENRQRRRPGRGGKTEVVDGQSLRLPGGAGHFPD